MQLLLEKWNLAQAERFGRSSEKMNYDSQTYQQLELAVMYAQCFNEAEATVQGDAFGGTGDRRSYGILPINAGNIQANGRKILSGLPHGEPVIMPHFRRKSCSAQLGPGIPAAPGRGL